MNIEDDELIKSLKGDENDDIIEQLEDKYNVDLTTFYGEDYDEVENKINLIKEIKKYGGNV